MLLQEAEVANSVTYSGHAKWHLRHGVTEFYVDIEKTMHHHAKMRIDILDQFTEQFAWSPEFLNYAMLDVPGIISLGPSAGISIGGKLIVAAQGILYTEFESHVDEGKIHMDFVNWNNSC